jgi:hypothetical protein
MKALAVGADVLVLKNEAGSMCKPLATHASRVCGAFHSGVRTGAFHTRVIWLRGSGVSIPILISFALNPRVKDSQAVGDHVYCELPPEEGLSCSEGVCIPNEGGFGVVNYPVLPAFNV